METPAKTLDEISDELRVIELEIRLIKERLELFDKIKEILNPTTTNE
jgi:hypothetical protein